MKSKLSIEIDHFLTNLGTMGITTAAIQSNSKISARSLSDWRNGKSEPNQENLVKLRDYSLDLLTSFGIDFPLKKEFREPLENFYRLIGGLLREMKKRDDKENIILEDNKNDELAQTALKPLLDFQVFDGYINTSEQGGFLIDKTNSIDRKIKKEYQENFVQNFNLLIDFIDRESEKDIEDLKDEMSEKRAVEFYSNLPHEEDYEELENIPKINSIAEFLLGENLGVSKTQIQSWKNEKDFPTEENLVNLRKLLHLEGERAFLMYKFQESKLEKMFLPSENKRVDDFVELERYNDTLEFFTNVLFFYCKDNPKVKQLKEDMEESLIEETQANIVNAFFREVRVLKNSRVVGFEDASVDNPEFFPYTEMSDEQVGYILRKDEDLLKRIFTSKNIELLNEISENPFFIDEQREQLDEMISLLKNREGVDFPYFRFRLLYHPDDHSSEDIEVITNGLAVLLHAPNTYKWFCSEYSYENLTEKEKREVRNFRTLALLQNNQELREKVKQCAIDKMEEENSSLYYELLMFFDDLSAQSMIDRIFYSFSVILVQGWCNSSPNLSIFIHLHEFMKIMNGSTIRILRDRK